VKRHTLRVAEGGAGWWEGAGARREEGVWGKEGVSRGGGGAACQVLGLACCEVVRVARAL